MLGLEELSAQDISLAHPDPLVLELNRLHNQLKEKERELGMAQSEIKALRASEVLKEKAVEELENELSKLDENLRLTETLVHQKNLDIKKLTNEKKEAIAAQYAAESTLRRVYANQKEDDSIPIESIIAPLEAEIKMYKIEILSLQEDKKAMERHTKSKEVALLEAERILKSALERALIVEEVQNQNYELRRQIKICQEEHKILDKTNRQKVLEVEKLSQTIKELEEAILAGGAASNAVRDYQRQISELYEEKRTLERELSRVKISANRVATVVANEWKDESGKVMPVKQWLEERRLLQAEMQRLRDRLAISDRTAKTEAQLKDKLRMRLKTLEEGLKYASSVSVNPNSFCGSPKQVKSNNFLGILSSNAGRRKKYTSHLKACKSKVVDGDEKENSSMKYNDIVNGNGFEDIKTNVNGSENEESQNKGSSNTNGHDTVSGFLYDKLQKEVISLRKICDMKDCNLNVKDEEIKMLSKKVETLIKAFEVESKKMKREATIREKDKVLDDNKNKRAASSLKSSK